MVKLQNTIYAITLWLLTSLPLTAQAQYADTLTVYAADSIEANTPETIAMFGYLAPHIDPFIVYAQLFWATNRFDPKLMRNNNPFQMIDRNGKLRKFDTLDESIARFVLAMADYNLVNESYTDYLERKPKSNWSPRMSKKLLEIYRGLYGTDYNHKKQLHTWTKNALKLRFAKADSITYGSGIKPYLKSYAITASDKNMIQPRMTLGPLEPLSNKVDTGLIFLQVLWATDHFNSKMIKHNNLFQVVDDEGELMRFDSWHDAVADYLIRILDYDKNSESYLTYLERKTNGQWNRKMSDKMRQLYRSLFHKVYDESQFKGFKAPKTENKRTKTSQSRNRL